MNDAIWRSVPLAEAAGATGLFVDGDWVETKDQNTEGEVRLIQLADVGIGEYLDKSNRRLTSETARRLRCTLLRENDILIARMPDPIGRACLFPGDPSPCVTVVDVCIVRPDPQVAEPRYLLHFLNSADFQARILGLIKGATRQRISRGNLQQVDIPLPPIDEQRRIAAILDQADDLRRKRLEALERLKHFPSAVMEELLRDANTTPVLRLDELVQRDDRINYGVVQPGPDVEQGIPLVRVENVVNEDFSRSNLKHISPQIEAQYSRSRLHGDEILVACVGSIGAVALVQPDQRGFNIARAVARIPIDPIKAERIFVAEYLKKPKTQAYFKSETRAVAQPTLNIKQLCETRLPVPPLSVQGIFAARVAEIDKLKIHHRAHFARLDALFTSLQHHAFRGEL